MSIEAQLVHTCSVRRASHSKSNQAKVFAWSTVATGVCCRVEPGSDVAQATVLGIGVAESRKVFFAGAEDIRNGDEITVSTGETLAIRSVQRFYAGGPSAHHLEAVAAVQDA